MTIAALVKNIQERRKKPDIYEHSFPKSSIIVERFPVSNSYITAHAHRLKKNPKICYFLEFIIGYLQCWMYCDRDLQYDIDVMHNV